jgi:hypothetical protein
MPTTSCHDGLLQFSQALNDHQFATGHTDALSRRCGADDHLVFVPVVSEAHTTWSVPAMHPAVA